MKLPYKVSFLSTRNGTAFNDYYLQINDIFVCTENTLVLIEALNIPNSKFGEEAFSLAGDGFNGYKVSLRMLKQDAILKDDELIEYIAKSISNVLDKLKTA